MVTKQQPVSPSDKTFQADSPAMKQLFCPTGKKDMRPARNHYEQNKKNTRWQLCPRAGGTCSYYLHYGRCFNTWMIR